MVNDGSGICVGPLSPSSARCKHFLNAEFKESLGEASPQEADVLPGVLSTSLNQLSNLRSSEDQLGAHSRPSHIRTGGFLEKRNDGDPHGSRGGSDDLGLSTGVSSRSRRVRRPSRRGRNHYSSIWGESLGVTWVWSRERGVEPA